MTQPVQEPTQGRIDSGQQWAVRQLFRRPAPASAVVADKVFVPFTPVVTLVSAGAGKVDPTVTSWGTLWLPNGLHDSNTINAGDPVFALFTFVLEDPGTFGASGIGHYLLTLEDVDGVTGLVAAPVVDNAVGYVGTALVAPTNFGGNSYDSWIGIESGGGGFVIETWDAVPEPTGDHRISPTYPEAWGSTGTADPGSVSGQLFFPAEGDTA